MQNFKILKNNEYASQLVNPHDIFENNFPDIPKNIKQLLRLYVYSSKCKILLVRSKKQERGGGGKGEKSRRILFKVGQQQHLQQSLMILYGNKKANAIFTRAYEYSLRISRP